MAFFVRLLLGLALIAAVVGAPRASGAQQRPAAFSADEQARLDRGELVIRRQSQARNGLQLVGGTAWIRVRVPPEALFRALLDTPRYTRIFPACSEARLVAREEGGRRVVEMVHHQGPVTAAYFLRARVDPTRRDLSFMLDDSRPSDIRAAWGFFTVHPASEGESILSYGVMVDVGGGLLGGLFRSQIQDWMMRVPNTVREYVEGSGRARYVAAR